MGGTIRQERQADQAAIAAVHRAAFAAQPEVADFVDSLRASDDYVERYSLVYEADGEIRGHVMLCFVDLVDGPVRHRVLCLTPLGVLPAHQRQGIGAALTTEALNRATADGEPLVIVEGIPDYYPRLGFESAAANGITFPVGVPSAAGMVKYAHPDAPRPVGRVEYPAAYRLIGE